MNRREAIDGLIALGATPWAARAQHPGKIWRVGFLATPSRPVNLDTHQFGQFVRGMRELGYFEGKNLAIEWRFADAKQERLPGLAPESEHDRDGASFQEAKHKRCEKIMRRYRSRPGLAFLSVPHLA